MNNWQHDFDASWNDSPTKLGYSLSSYILVALVSMILTCLLLIVAARWSVTNTIIDYLLGNNHDSAGKTVEEQVAVTIETVTPLPTQASPTHKIATKYVAPTSQPSTPQPYAAISGVEHPKPDERFYPPDIAKLRLLMLSSINQDRAKEGLSPVEWDETASLAGQLHAEDMMRNNYFSHWNLYGYGPDHRYALIGGTDVIAENIHMYWQRFDDGSPVPFNDWDDIILKAEESLMNSPGHRKNILTPAHTHVGVGIAYDAEKGEMRLSQEFINHYLEIDPIPHEIHLDDIVVISGRSLLGEKEVLVNLAYQPFPSTPSRLNVRDGAYKSEAEIYSALPLPIHNDAFELEIPINYNELPGIYSIRIWIDLHGNDEMTQAATITLWVR